MALPHGIETGRRLSLVDGHLQMAEKIPYNELSAAQKLLLDRHLQAATRTARNCESLRDPLERKYIGEVVTKLYAGLDLPLPAIHILGSPMSCAFAWSHTPQAPADRWRVFHDDEYYTHPLSATVVDVIGDGYNAFTRLVDLSIQTSMTPMLSDPIRQDYVELERVGELVFTAITNVENPLQNTELVEMFRNEVKSNIGDPAIRDFVTRQPASKLERLFLPSPIFRGQQYAQTAYYQAMSELGMPFIGYHKNLISLWQQMNKACHWWFPYKHALLLSDRPSDLHLDDRGRLHNPKGPAIRYRDGWKLYAWKGILISKNVIEDPLTVSDILDEDNAEVRRVMVDIFGIDRFVVESKSKTLDKQGEYELLEVPYLDDGGHMMALKMRCPTTLAVYVHTVHPECTNIEQALAWKRGEDDFKNARPYKEGLLWEK